MGALKYYFLQVYSIINELSAIYYNLKLKNSVL